MSPRWSRAVRPQMLALPLLVLLACGGETVDTADRSVGAGGSPSAGQGGASGGSAVGGNAAAGNAAGGSLGIGGGGPSTLEQLIDDVEGVWLVGWSGGMNHFSWMQFRVDDDFSGKVRILDPVDVPSNTPFWGCQGEGTWNLAARPNTIFVSFPEGCATAGSPMTFGPLEPAEIPGALFKAKVEVGADVGPAIVEGHKMDGSQCDAAFTVCKGPF